jgi:drug/metabolite transporter (DMT)-like permease
VSRETLGLLIGFVGVCIFAGTLPFTRIAVEELDPWFVTAGRASLSGACRRIDADPLAQARARLRDA